ncbi:hypothetical protein E2C01_001739 [Portunus trituberculatus]|uniref:Uncharacterized protein n=1 Tax=Portunus trituberculatus TaxID=210409 RepID=A0A5B7CI16_PORTR|nr:hypothetical protein [Portunus trituberculatus]
MKRKLADKCFTSCSGEVMSVHSLLRSVLPSSGLLVTSRRGGKTRRRTNLRISICLLCTSAGGKEEGTQDADQAEAVAVLFLIWTVFVNVKDQVVQDFQHFIDQFRLLILK